MGGDAGRSGVLLVIFLMLPKPMWFTCSDMN